MIRHYNATDRRRIKPNEFSDIRDADFVFEDDDFYKFSLVEDNEVYAIICFKRYWKNNFIAFFLISEDIKILHARELRTFIYDAAFDLGAERIQTDSIDCEVLNKWHRFLGFKIEGKRIKMMYDQDYNCWAVLKGEDF